MSICITFQPSLLGRPLRHCLTLVSGPDVADGDLSNALHNGGSPGDVLRGDDPLGHGGENGHDHESRIQFWARFWPRGRALALS